MRGGWAGLLLLLLLLLLLPLKRRAWLTESAVQGWSQETFSVQLLCLLCLQEGCLPPLPPPPPPLVCQRQS
jgi:hypothetical protein